MKSSKKLEQQTQLKTMKDLLAMLKSNNEQLFEVNTHIFCEESSKKEVLGTTDTGLWMKVNEEEIPIVFYSDFSNHKIADTI